MENKTITVITAGMNKPSSTQMLADKLAEATASELKTVKITVTVNTIDLRDFAHEILNNFLTGFPAPNLEEKLRVLYESDGVIAVSPIFNTSYSGLFKMFVDILEPDYVKGIPVLLGATGGTPRHSLAIDYAMRPMFTHLHMRAGTVTVFVATDEWGSGTKDGDSLASRVENSAKEFVHKIVTSNREKPLIF